MTVTANGARPRCDYAACSEPAITGAGDSDWFYCTEHAGRQAVEAAADDHDAALVLTAQGAHLQPAPATVRVVDHVQARRNAAIAAHPAGKSPTAPAAAPTGPSPLGLLLEQASGHTVAKVRRLAERIEAQLDDLRALMQEHEAGEAQRRAEAAAQEKARAEVARLEAALAAAKAKLKGKPTGRGTHALVGRKQAPRPPMPCPDCGTVVAGNQGLALHRKARHRSAS